MLKIRLQRIGKKGQAYFRIVVTEHTQKPKGRFVEDLGNYDPHKNTINAKKERIEYWMSNGAQPSPTVNNLLVGREIIKGEKVKAWKPKKKAEGTKLAETKAGEKRKATDREGQPSEERRPSGEQGSAERSSANARSGESSRTNPESTEGSSPNVEVAPAPEAPAA